MVSYERHTCRIVGQHRGTQRYVPTMENARVRIYSARLSLEPFTRLEFTFNSREGRQGSIGEAARARAQGRRDAHATSCHLESSADLDRRTSASPQCWK